jgi:hypothetical protein
MGYMKLEGEQIFSKISCCQVDENLLRFSKLYVDRQAGVLAGGWEDVKLLAQFCMFSAYLLCTSLQKQQQQ